MQREKVDIDGEKGAQINVVAKKILAQGIQTSYTLYLVFIFSFFCLYYVIDQAIYYIFSLLSLYYVTDFIKRLELRLLVTFIFNKD